MFDNRRRVLVKDEITLKNPSEVYSFLSVYKSGIELLSDKSGAVLSKGNKKMLVKIKANKSYDLSVMDAVQMDASLRYEGDDTHPAENDWTEDFQRLALHFEDAENLDISMIFVPFYGSEIPSVCFDSTAIADWKLSKTDDLPKLSEVYLDGQKFDNFNPDENYHSLVSDSITPAFSALSDEGSVAIHKNGSEYVVVVTSDKGVSNTYHFSISSFATITADTYVGGGIDVYNKNYGSSDIVSLMINGWASRLAYYKIDLGTIPEGKQVKKVSLELSVCRESSSGSTEPLGFYMTDYDSWNESTVVCAQAPISLGYKKSVSSDPWFPIKSYDAASDTYSNVDPDVTINHKFGHTVPFNYSISDADFVKEVIDITDVYAAGGNKSKIAFAIAVSKKSSANSVMHIASKEHSDPSLRPRVIVELEDTLSVKAPKLVLDSDFDEDASYDVLPRCSVVKEGYELRAVASITASAQTLGEGKLIAAQYDEDGCLVAITQKDIGPIPANTSARPASDKFVVLSETAQIKTFVWSGDNVPFVIAAEVYTLQ